MLSMSWRSPLRKSRTSLVGSTQQPSRGCCILRGFRFILKKRLAELIQSFKVDCVTFSYSDVSYPYVMERSAIVNAGWCGFLVARSPSYDAEVEKTSDRGRGCPDRVW